jgi:hypothetical protein
MGVALGVAAGALELSWYLPALAGDDLIAYRDVGLLLSGGAVLAGPGWDCGTARPGPPTCWR